MNFAKHAGNFDSVEEQQAFASDTASFLETEAMYHLLLSLFLRKVLFDVNFLDAILKLNVFRKIMAFNYPLAIKGMMGIYLGYKVMLGILGFIGPLINVHLRYFFDLLLVCHWIGKENDDDNVCPELFWHDLHPALPYLP